MAVDNTLPTVLLIVNLLRGLLGQLSHERRLGAVHPPLILLVQLYVCFHLPHVDDIHVHGLERRVVACNRQIIQGRDPVAYSCVHARGRLRFHVHGRGGHRRVLRLLRAACGVVRSGRLVAIELQLALVGAHRVNYARVLQRADIAGAGSQGGERGSGNNAQGGASGNEGRHGNPSIVCSCAFKRTRAGLLAHSKPAPAHLGE